jgi:hypothetical protein
MNNTAAAISINDAKALAATAGLDNPTSQQERLLAIITDPDQSTGQREGGTHLEIAESYEEEHGSYRGGDFRYDVACVADFLYGHYVDDLTGPEFSLSIEASVDLEFTGFRICAVYGDGIRLSEFVEAKHATTDREAEGLAGALAIAEALDYTFSALREKGTRNRLPLRTV